MKPSLANAVFIILSAGTLAACSGGADEGARDAGPDAAADPVLELLARPHVQGALAAAAAAGYPIATETGANPPPLTGYYLKPFLEGRFLASGNGANLTSGVAGSEVRVTVHGGASATTAFVGFTNSGILSSNVTSGLLLRGTDNNFTLYQSLTVSCPVQGSDLVLEMFSIESGRFVPSTGDWEAVRNMGITVATTGTRVSGCEPVFAGDTEVAGGWILGEVPRYLRISVDDLQYMCVDEDAGYVAGQSWTRADGTPCTCTDYFLVECA